MAKKTKIVTEVKDIEVKETKPKSVKKEYTYRVDIVMNDQTYSKLVDDIYDAFKEIEVPEIVSGFVEINITNLKTGETGFRQLRNFETKRMFNDPISLKILADTLN